MPPRRRAVVPDTLPFSPGQQSTDSFVARKQQATSWALDGLASSPELAHWGDQLHGKLRRWQRAFTAAMIALIIATSALAYQTAVRHTGSSLSGPFVESFDKLSSNSQQALQQLVTQGSKLIPEGSSIRDSFDKLSFNSQQALYHLANSGLSLPSLLPQKHKQASLDDTMAAGTLDSKAAEAMLAQLRSDLQSAERENAMVSDLLQRSQQDLSLSQAHTHELLASVANIEDDRTLLASQKAYLEAALEKVPEGKEYSEQCPQCPTCDDAPQCPTCDDAESLYGNFGSQGWLLGALAAANVLFMGFMYSPDAALRPVRAVYRSCFSQKAKQMPVSRNISDSSESMTTDSTVSRNTSSGVETLLDGMSDAQLQQRWQECFEPTANLSSAAGHAGSSPAIGSIKAPSKACSAKASPTKASPVKGPPVKAPLAKESSGKGLSGPSTPRSLALDSVDSQGDTHQKIQALTALAEQHDELANDLKVANADLLQTKGELAEAVASLEAGKGGLAAQTDHAAQLQTQLELTQDKVAGARAGACAAENNLRTAEEKVNELTHNLDSDKISHSQAMKELRLQQAEEKQALEAQLAQVNSEKAAAETRQAELAETISSLDAAKSDLAAQTERAAQLQSQLHLIQEEVDGARADAAAAQSSLQTAKEKITELTDCLDLANTSYEQTAKELQQQHAHDLQAVNAQLAQVKVDKATAETELKQKLSELAELTQELRDAMSVREAAEATSEQTTAELTQLKKDLADTSSAKEAAEATLQQARTDAELQAQDLADATSAQNTAEASLEQARADAEEQKQDLADAISARDVAEAALKQTQTELEQQGLALASVTAAKDIAEARLQQAESDAEQHEQVLSDAIQDKESAEATLGQARADVKRQKQALADVSDAKESAQSALEQANVDAQKHKHELAAAVSAKDSADSTLQQATADAKQQQQTLAEIEADKQAAESALAQARADVQQQKQELAAAVSAKDSAESTVQQARADTSQQQQALADVTSAKDSAESALQRARAEIQQHKQQLADALSAKDTAGATLEQARADVKQQRQMLADATSGKLSAESALQQAKAEAQQQKQAANRAKDFAEAALEQARADAKREHQYLLDATSAKEAAEANLGQAEVDAEQQKQVLADATSARISLQAALEQARADAERQRGYLTDAKSGKGSIEGSLQESRAESSRLSKALADALSAQSESQAGLNQRQDEVRGLKTELEETHKACEHMQKVIYDLEASWASVSSAQEDLNAASDMNDRLADQVEERDAQLDTLKQHYEDLQKQYTQKSAELADYSRQASADFKSYVAQSQSVEEVLNSKIESLRSHRQASYVQVQSLQRELEAAYAQISSLQFQYGGPQQEGRLQVGQDLRLVTRSNSFGTPMRSPRSPSGSSTSSGTSRGARGIDFQTQLADAQKRIVDLEAEVAASKLEISLAAEAGRAPCLRCMGMDPVFREVLAQRSLRPSTFSQAWRGTGEYNQVRSSAFANLVSSSGGTPTKAAGSPSVSLSSRAVETVPEFNSHADQGAADLVSHAVEDAHGPIPSHALEDDIPSFAPQGSLDSPQSSVGSVGVTHGADLNLDLSRLNALSPRLSSPFQPLAQTPHPDSPAHPASALNTGRTPLSSHAVAHSTDSDSQLITDRTGWSSHVIDPSSSSGSRTDEAFTPTSVHQDVFL